MTWLSELYKVHIVFLYNIGTSLRCVALLYFLQFLQFIDKKENKKYIIKQKIIILATKRKGWFVMYSTCLSISGDGSTSLMPISPSLIFNEK